MIRRQRALRRPLDDSLRVLPAPRRYQQREVCGQAARRLATSPRGMASTPGIGSGADVGSSRDPKTVSDSLARGDDHLVVFLEDDDVGDTGLGVLRTL